MHETSTRITRTCEARGVSADDVLRWPGVPPMFAFRDPDGNGLELIEQS